MILATLPSGWKWMATVPDAPQGGDFKFYVDEGEGLCQTVETLLDGFHLLIETHGSLGVALQRVGELRPGDPTYDFASQAVRTIDKVDLVIEAELARTRPTFSPVRYPYTYAADFLREHFNILPQEVVWKVSGKPESRLVAAEARLLWAEQLGIPEEVLARKLADAFLRENGIAGLVGSTSDAQSS